jgi:ubiquinone/menaquinone biosynthesis C-methylase UbiE
MSNNDNYEMKNCAESYKIMDGKKYLNEENTNSIYYLPSDDIEMSRITLEHNLFRYIWQGTFSSKIEERLIKGNTKVIDLGCGTGQWTLDMSLRYPSSTFIGIDIEPSFFPPKEEKPENLAFLQHNLVENPGVPFPDRTFDFTFMRNLVFSLDDNKGWFHVISEAVRVTNLNGCIEIGNYDLYRDNTKEVHGGPIFGKLHHTCKYCSNISKKDSFILQFIYLFIHL